MQTYETTVSITQVYNLAKLRKRKNKYTAQVFKFLSPASQPILVSPRIWTPPPLNEKNSTPFPSKMFLRTKPPSSSGGETPCSLGLDQH